MTQIYLSLGSNIGDRAGNIARAIAALGAHGVRVTRQSSLYETEPVDVPEQPRQDWYLNAAVEAETGRTPQQLMKTLLAIESSLGRVRRIPKGPRIIDIDILLFGGHAVDEPDLKIPHPRMSGRRFVLAPLAEIAPDAQHPILKKSGAQLLAETPDHSEVKLFAAKESHATS